MGSFDVADVEEEAAKLVNRAKKIKIDDGDIGDWEDVRVAFSNHLHCIESAAFGSPNSNKPGRNKKAQVIYSDITSTEQSVLCGLTNGDIVVIDPNNLTESVLNSHVSSRKHNGLSCVRSSKSSPTTFYSSSGTEGSILMWDNRENSRKAVQKFSTTNLDATKDKSDGSSTSGTAKPILTFDVNAGDQILCGGTELVDEDSYLFFWDVRSSKLLGAYWESHSDDVTAVKFHPTRTHSLASGSTDGLLNVFNLLESAEEDALLFSFNTQSSVETIFWSDSNTAASASKPMTTVACVTHTNEVKLWDAESGDPVTEFSRDSIAKAMMRSNSEAVHINGCYQTDQGSMGLLSCSLSGDCARFLEMSGSELHPKSLYLDQSAVVQTAEFLPKSCRWITFDEDGLVKLWAPDSTLKSIAPTENAVIQSEGKQKRRYRPYWKESKRKK